MILLIGFEVNVGLVVVQKRQRRHKNASGGKRTGGEELGLAERHLAKRTRFANY